MSKHLCTEQPKLAPTRAIKLNPCIHSCLYGQSNHEHSITQKGIEEIDGDQPLRLSWRAERGPVLDINREEGEKVD